MPLETGTFISDLVITNPDGGDQKLQGDDHLRLIKTASKNTFPDASQAFYFEKTSAKTADYTVVAADDRALILVDATSAAVVVSAPDPTIQDGLRFRVKKTDSSGNLVTIEPDGSETFDGAADVKLQTQFDYVDLISDGTNWHVLAIRQVYESVEYTLVVATGAATAHNLLSKPLLVYPVLRCNTAEHGYVAGDEIPLSVNTDPDVTVAISATTIGIRFISGTLAMNVLNATTGAFSGITNNNWRIVLYGMYW